MDPRIRTLLSWQLRFQSRRMLTWVFGGVYVLLPLLLIAMSPNLPTMPPGQLPFRILQTVHALGAAVAAIVLAGQSMDDKPSGTLGFLKVANLAPGSWVTFRFLALFIGYLPIWILRIPIYVLVVSLGGVMWEDVLWLEAVQWAAFLSISCLALLVARYSTTGSSLAIATFLIVWLWQAVLYFPLIVTAILNLFQNAPPRTGDHPIAIAIGQLALPRYFWSRPSNATEWTMALLGIALHLILAFILLRMLAKTVFFNAGTEMATEEPALTRAERRSNTRPSRRVSDDPLAWQACHIHAGTNPQTRTSAVVIASFFVLALAFGVIDEVVPRSLVIGVTCGMTLVILAFKPSDCLSREVKAKTLSTLALLPLDGREIYEGWRRGARRLARSAYIAAAGGGIILSIIVPEAAPFIWMVLAFAVLLLPEVAFLSNLMAKKVSFLEFDWAQLAVNFWILFVIGMMLAISLPIAIGINPWAGLATFVGLLFVARSLFMTDFVGYMAERVEREQ